jgi:hypothetical protein
MRSSKNPVSSTFNVILTYERLSGRYTNERPPEDEELLVETYVGVYVSFNINFAVVHQLVFVTPFSLKFLYDFLLVYEITVV